MDAVCGKADEWARTKIDSSYLTLNENIFMIWTPLELMTTDLLKEEAIAKSRLGKRCCCCAAAKNQFGWSWIIRPEIEASASLDGEKVNEGQPSSLGAYSTTHRTRPQWWPRRPSSCRGRRCRRSRGNAFRTSRGTWRARKRQELTMIASSRYLAKEMMQGPQLSA